MKIQQALLLLLSLPVTIDAGVATTGLLKDASCLSGHSLETDSQLLATDDSCVQTEKADSTAASSESSYEVEAPASLTQDEQIGADIGEPQVIDGSYKEAILHRIQAARSYLTEEVMADEKYEKVRDMCVNKHASCAFWAVIGECEKNPGYVNMCKGRAFREALDIEQDVQYKHQQESKSHNIIFLSLYLSRFMEVNCAPVCSSCEKLHLDTRCPMDPDAVDALQPGDLNKMFERITTHPEYQQYEPVVISRPSYAPGDGPENATYSIGIWMLMFENALSDEEAERMIELGGLKGYERSKDVGEQQADGTFSAEVSHGRTSTNAVSTIQSIIALSRHRVARPPAVVSWALSSFQTAVVHRRLL
jgi:hypothetical protein